MRRIRGRSREGGAAPADRVTAIGALANGADRAKFPAEGKRMRTFLAVVGLLALSASGDGAAQSRPETLKLAASVNLENKRPVALLNFEIVAPAGDKTQETVVVRLEKPLAAGESARLPLAGGDGCQFQARWAFEDFADAGDVDLCGNAHIVLVD